MNLQNLSDIELDRSTIISAKEEKLAMTRVLHHLCEVQRRKLFSRRECDSLFSYCVRILGYSEREASSRVNAARAMREFPELEESINSGTLNLTTISQAQTFFNQEAKLREKPLTKEEKKEVLVKLEEKSVRETERILVSLSCAPEKVVKEKLRPLSDQLTEVRFVLDEETIHNLQRLQEIWSHAMPGANLSEIVKRMAKESCQRHDPIQKAERSHARKTGRSKENSFVPLKKSSETKLLPTTESKESTRLLLPKSNKTTLPSAGKCFGKNNLRTRVIPATARHAVWRRDGGVCQFFDHNTGKRCGSRHFLELDHLHPFALGGENTVENLRLRCRAHNTRHAVQAYGSEFMNVKTQANRQPSLDLFAPDRIFRGS